ncbi:hypothetical protein PV10_01112 [Exophiala mesophila]|uniref:RINT-1 family protein n=1 Tax=Exophiala mesophila TaxID=212818 RepID=A0A0D1X6A4_EXOME|nr:uncharacterized protein PV10_01112 [Exophiala mesophila]KIV97350.1 hypothetical protein PV10_01112 [Exophiala mesophila]
MADLHPSRAVGISTRVQDYLDDKIQNAADLDNVDELLAKVQQQQEILKKQLEEARNGQSEVEQNIATLTTTLRERALEFQARQNDLDQRLKELTQSDVTTEATKKIESRMNKLGNLEIAQAYLELLQEMDRCDTETSKHLTKKPDESIKSYLQLHSLWTRMKENQPSAEGAAPQLLYIFEQQTTRIFKSLKDSLEKSLRKTLDEMNWPSRDMTVSSNAREKWENQVQLLLEIQEPDLVQSAPNDTTWNAGPPPEPVTLFPLEVMINPLAARFRYHFYGDRPTNRLDKPEYFLSHVLDLIEQHSNFVIDILGPILDQRALKSEALESIYSDPISAFITGLLPMVRAKSLSFLPQVVSEPQLFSHFMREIMLFDSSIRDSWGYIPIPRMLGDWRGVTWDLLYTHGYFQSWLTVERDFALSRYNNIRDDREGREIDFDAEAGQTKPTKTAIRIADLLETITDRYRALNSFSYKIRFLIDIQIHILEEYHRHLADMLQAYVATTHTAGRLLQGQTESDAFGLKGLELITKIYGSAEFLQRKLSDWSDDVFFLELWDELSVRAKGSEGGNASIGNNLNVDDVAAKTSTAIKNDDDGEYDGSGPFDQTVGSFLRLRERSEEQILRAFEVNVRAALKPYVRHPQWSSLGDSRLEGSVAPSSALDGLSQSITILLGYIARVLAPGALRRVVKHIYTTIQKEMLDNVVLSHTFSTAGANQLRTDILAIKEVVERTAKLRGIGDSSMKRLDEAATLLSLAASEENSGEDEDASGAEWGFEEKAEPSVNGEESPGGASHELSLWEVDNRLFTDNPTARKVLAELGIYHLDVTEARNVLRRRVEITAKSGRA